VDNITVIKLKPRGGLKRRRRFHATLTCQCGKTKKFIRDIDEPMPGKWWCGECWEKRSKYDGSGGQ